MTRRTVLASGLATLALGALGGIGIGGAQPLEPDHSRDAGQRAEPMSMQDNMRQLHRRMIDGHRDMIRNPEMRGHMRDPEMRAMHRDMMRMHGGMMGMRDEMPRMDMTD
ncbi:MAG: hypothetical protein ACRDPC_17075 [Solirubrobacteraceae bacterium]